MKYQGRSPTRVDLAGGTLDCWPLYLFVGDCVTVNLSIDVYTGCELEVLESPKIEIDIADLQFRRSFENIGAFLSDRAPEHKLVQAVVEYYHQRIGPRGFRLKTFSESPVGGGLGGSSSLCISLLKAFSGWLNIGEKPRDVYETVTLAGNLEAKVIRAPTGTQDYFAAIQPGLNIIHYTSAGARLETVPIHPERLFENLLLVYTGRAHHSGINNWQVIKSVIEGDTSTLSALKEIALVANEVAEVCRKQKWNLLPELFAREFDSRIRLSASFTSPEIERVKQIAIEHGAKAAKICGAGGGGCVLVWAERQFHERIGQECRRNGFQPINIQPANGLNDR